MGPSHTGEEMEGGGVVIYGDGTEFLNFCSWVCAGVLVRWAHPIQGKRWKVVGGFTETYSVFELLHFCSKEVKLVLNIHRNHFCSWVCAGFAVRRTPSHTGEDMEGGGHLWRQYSVFELPYFCSK